eukprot:TRINITY_DN28_c0_g1_i2.p2 TRINITY_DN28_c0_g1~~TRINITY_DN28_c0_g1_i2.p2  ORF type:complete len:105 (-),score=19.25 TRINITY_DN28_c0_g1_i2:143-427(-)
MPGQATFLTKGTQGELLTGSASSAKFIVDLIDKVEKLNVEIDSVASAECAGVFEAKYTPTLPQTLTPGGASSSRRASRSRALRATRSACSRRRT